MITCFKYNREIYSQQLSSGEYDEGAGRCSGCLAVRGERCVDRGEDRGGGDGPGPRHHAAPRPASRGPGADVGHATVLLHHRIEVGVLHGFHGCQPLLMIIPRTPDKERFMINILVT